MEPTAILNLALAAASTAIFALVAETVRRRPVSPELKGPRDAFVLWWHSLALLTAMGAGMFLLAQAGHDDLALFLTMTVVVLFILCVALWGLLYYLVFLFTNSKRSALPIAVGYFLFFAWLLYFILHADPIGVTTENGQAELTFANQPDPRGLSSVLVTIALIVPIVGAAIGYFTLYWKVRERHQRRRVLLVSLSILLWFATAGIGGLSADPRSQTWQVASRLVGLAASLTIYYAFRLRPEEPRPADAQATPGAASAPPAQPPQPPRSKVLHG